jgi:hypothetical protein
MTLLLAAILFCDIVISTLLIFGNRNAIKKSVGDFVDSGYGIGNFNTDKEVTAIP